ncbi:MAG: hypothetical protein PF541_15995 [Prolixibacteraceae bacterium]|jgi:acyl carrier protein|nr:hypothetical protein [Prolixibacteraceae bacterium]
MISLKEKKLYRVLRNVGIKRTFIKKARSIEDLYLDDFDFRLLVFYFENEFNVRLKKNDIKILTTLPAFYQYVGR